MVTFRVVAALAIAALLGACDSPRTPLEARDLHTAAQHLQSTATEAEWLARELNAGSVTQNMAWLHQQALGQDAAKAVEPLMKPVPEPLRAQHEQVLQIAARLQAQVGRIAQAAKAPGELDDVRSELEAVARATKPLAGQA